MTAPMASYQNREIDRLVELIADRVRDRIGRGDLPPLSLRDRGDCIDDDKEDCGTCGGCVIRRPWSVRAVEDAGASRVGAGPGVGAVEADLGRMIDHTLLRPDATRDEVVKLCDEARQHHFASVCINTTWVPLCRSLLRGSDVKVCSVVGFPLGAMAPTAKAYEARDAVRQGAQEIDMVINLGAMKSRDYETVFEDICRVVKAAAPALVKVILETGQLSDDEKIIACTLSKLAGAHFVKTSTGFGKGGATVEDVALMRRVVGSEMGVKASGGVRTQEDALRMRAAGANRIGASASVAIVSGPSGDKDGRDRDRGKGKAKAGSGY
jgi:deoxyribose-phosphate aldolase